MGIRSLAEWFCLSVFYLSGFVGPAPVYPNKSAPVNDFPLSLIDRKIDALGAENQIRSEDDARAYVDALLEKFQIDEKQLPGLTEFKSKLVRAELSAVVHPESRIPESLVGQVFNDLMAEWQTPTWTRVSPEELHAFRVTMSLALYPNSVSRLADGNLPRNCRPVEALYLIYLLHSSMGVQPELRDAIRAGRWPSEDPRALPSPGAPQLQPLKKSRIELERLREYRAALSAYCAAHPDVSLHSEVGRLFARLRIG